MHDQARSWYERRHSRSSDWPLPDLLAAKGSTRVSVVLPARDEQRTVGGIVAAIRDRLMHRHPLVDELVVMDSGSTDRTARVAAAAGARVVSRADVLPEIPPVPGKGEVLWRSLAATTGQLVVFCDADLTDFDPGFLVGLLGPLLTDRGVHLVKAAYDRPLSVGRRMLPAGGGRVTELVARPLLNLYWPLLAGFVQPLAGEYAARRELLERLPFPTGYGVDIGLLIDALGEVGLDGLAQVDLGRRSHRHQPDAALGAMSSEIVQAVLHRLTREGRAWLPEPSAGLVGFARSGDGYQARTVTVAPVERPPMREMVRTHPIRATIRSRSPAAGTLRRSSSDSG
ncbi:MAG: glucosyl-3-phosphoglycerate synthase [Actinobacteria bacterium]|nr:glucosyl-3-phosphoglycerate synthase [Actinomycetota bacterium]MBI3688442.1 glucosyl-3-phosphoglycerate synthase [Actinomycetota bacterium]